MVEILRNFEQMAGRFPPAVLLAPGLALVALGLVVWLAGMCLRRLVLALAGAGVVGMIALGTGSQNSVVIGLAIGAGAVLGALLPRLSTAVLLALLGTVVVLVTTVPALPVEGSRLLSHQPEPGPAAETFTVPESLDILRAHALDMADYAKAVARHLRLVDLAVSVAVGLMLLALGLFLPRLAGAMTCSMLGSSLIFAGLIVLLIFKGSGPIGLIQPQGAFYGLVLLGMATFGTVEQLVLCPWSGRKQKERSGRSGPQREKSEHGWRGR
jgi:hypothetical protein